MVAALDLDRLPAVLGEREAAAARASVKLVGPPVWGVAICSPSSGGLRSCGSVEGLACALTLAYVAEVDGWSVAVHHPTYFQTLLYSLRHRQCSQATLGEVGLSVAWPDARDGTGEPCHLPAGELPSGSPADPGPG